MNDGGRSLGPICLLTLCHAHLRDQALRKTADLAGNIIDQFASSPTDSGKQV